VADHLVERIAENHWVLFVGSGISSSAVNRTATRHLRGAAFSRRYATSWDPDLKRIGHQLIQNRELLAPLITFATPANEAKLHGYQSRDP